MNEHEITVSGGSTVRLKTAGKYCKVDILVTAEEGGGGGGDQLDALIAGTLTEVSSGAQSVRENAFYNYTSVEWVSFPAATSVGRMAFYGCSNLKEAYLPAVTGEVPMSCFNSCSVLEKLDLGYAQSIASYALYSCSNLRCLILRRSDAICSLASSNLSGSAIASGTGYIYVPSALIDTYKAASYWSTYAAQFRVLEDYTVDGTVTGALDASKI